MDCAGGRWMMFTRSTPPSTNPSQNGTRRPATAGQSSFAPSAGPCPGAVGPGEFPHFLKETRPMHRHIWLILAALAILAVVPVFAHADHGNSTLSTQECLDHMANKLKNSGR